MTVERFWSLVDKTGDCWVWTGARSEKGYGRLVVNGRKVRAHRVSWEMANGPIPAGIFVLHHCDNPPCVNPAHLSLGTNEDNVADCVAKGRHARAKLSEAIVREIRSLAETEPLRAIARYFGLDRNTVRAIVRRLTWRRVA